jgi:flavodoxin
MTMKKAVIIYNSRTGITMRYAEEMGAYLNTKDIDAQVYSIMQFKEGVLNDADYVLLGCWTSGLMVILQHPEKKWVEFAKKLPSMPEAKLALFTTYKILTGSMFRNMYKRLKGKFNPPALILKSLNERLSQDDKRALDQFIT